MNIVLLETSTAVCSAALASERNVVLELHSDMANAHSHKLALFVDEILKYANSHNLHIDAVCVSSGPGSYTGLRIGVSSAKGLCYALDIPLLAVPTLQSMASLYCVQHPDYSGFVCPMIDARRMECYTAVYAVADGVLTQVRPVEAEIIVDGCYDAFLDQDKMVFVGDGAPKTVDTLGVHSNALFDKDFTLSAKGLAVDAFSKFEKGDFVDVAYFEPFYLKDFLAKKSVVRGLR